MQVNFISGGVEAYDRLLYGEQRGGVSNFLRERFMEKAEAIGRVGREHIEEALSRFDKFHNNDLARATRAAVRKAKSLRLIDEIQAITTVGDFQHLPSSMIDSVMALPMLRRMFNRGEVDGYNGRYVNKEPEAIGVEHRDYRKVMSGIAVDEEYGLDLPSDGTQWCESDDDTEDLTFDQQVDMIHTWRAAQDILEARKSDPTSKYDASL